MILKSISPSPKIYSLYLTLWAFGSLSILFMQVLAPPRSGLLTPTVTLSPLELLILTFVPADTLVLLVTNWLHNKVPKPKDRTKEE